MINIEINNDYISILEYTVLNTFIKLMVSFVN